MVPVIENLALAENIYQMKLKAPLVCDNYRPGQFIVIMADEKGERIPLTIVQAEDGIITLIYQVVGSSTRKLSLKRPGDQVHTVLGPLGHPSEIKKFGTVICVGGGVGTAVLFPEVKALKQSGNRILTVIGSRSKDLLILKREMTELSHELFITTEDGSEGEKGLVTQPLERILSTRKIDLVIAIGPVAMMKAVSGLTRSFHVKTIVSLNPIMVDATGMCGACRVTVSHATKFACVDGPEFDGHQVDFDNLLLRTRQYLRQEKEAHACLR